MNKAQLQKNVGARVRLRPQATEALGAHDDDWTVRKVSDEIPLESTMTPSPRGRRAGPLSTIRTRMDRPFFRFVSLSMRQRVEEDVNTDGVPGGGELVEVPVVVAFAFERIAEVGVMGHEHNHVSLLIADSARVRHGAVGAALRRAAAGAHPEVDRRDLRQ